MKEIYDWIPWFGELAQKIAEGSEQYLIDRAKRVAWRDSDKEHPLLSKGDENIDPFSFFYTLANRSGKEKSRQVVYPSIEHEFEMTHQLQVDCDEAFLFPIPPAVNLLFHDGEYFDPQLLWRLFRSAVSGPDAVDAHDFDGAHKIPRVASAKLTQALFLINPAQFIPFDDRTTPLISDPPAGDINWADYKEILQKFRDALPGCKPCEINLFAWYRQQKQVKTENLGYFQVSTNAQGDGTDYWKDFKSNNWVYTGGAGRHAGWDEYDSNSSTKRYPVDKAQPGDIVLVRTGMQKGRGIGVVYRNGYGPEFKETTRMHVLWLNKVSAEISGKGLLHGFSFAGEPTKTLFRQVEEYAPTLELLDRLDPQGRPAEDQSKGGPHVEHPRNRILYGPPGTGKTWNTVNHALAIIDSAPVQSEVDRGRFDTLRDAGQIEMVTFHQNFAYEDFIEGIRPVLAAGSGLAYELKAGIFKRLAADAAMAEQNKPFVLIIDEINRGNIAKIFGELITLIEDSRRIGGEDATYIKLPYSGERFGVPDNLYIIGTMNTADRGIQLLDTALRRRFTFIETMSDPEHEGICRHIQGVDCGEMLKIMNERIMALFDREHQIGHTYLLRVTDMEGLSNTFRNRIFPLLQEYFFDDWAKIDEVLGKNGFVKKRNTKGLFRDVDQAEDRTIFERLTDGDPAWKSPESYQRIYASRATGG